MKRTSVILTILGLIGFILSTKLYNTYADFYSGTTLVLFITVMIYGIYIGEDKQCEN